jgi:amidase
VIGGPDGYDPEVPPVPWRPAGPADLNGLRVAYSPGFPALVDAEIRAGADRLAGELDELGAVVEDRLPDPALASYGQLVEEFLAVLESGSVQEYLAILDRRDRFIASWDRFFAGCDVFLAPAMPMRAWPADDEPADDSPQMQAFLALELSQVSGCPMVVIPAGTDGNGVPFGLQLMGPRWADERLLAIAEAIAAVTGGFQPPPGF